jgi:hypothetical protein
MYVQGLLRALIFYTPITPGPNPAIVSYNASAVKNLQRHE